MPMHVVFDQYVFPKNNFPPKGHYRGMVDMIVVSKSKKTGTYCFDACYEIWDARDNIYRIKQRIAVGTPCLNNLLDAFESEEVPITAFEIEDMFDVNLNMNLDYDKDGCCHIIHSSPVDHFEEV